MHGHPREHAVHKQVRSLRMQLVRDLAELRDLVGISFSDNGGAILSKPFLDRSTLVRKVFVQGRIVIPVSVLKGFERARRELFQGQIHLVRGLEPVKALALPCPEVAPVRQADESQPQSSLSSIRRTYSTPVKPAWTAAPVPHLSASVSVDNSRSLARIFRGPISSPSPTEHLM